MRATVLNGPGDVSLETVDDPVLPGPDGAIVRVTSTAICGSDLHLYHGTMGAPGVRLGHEFVGEIVEVGAEVRRVGVGDRVLASAVVGCADCEACRSGDPVRCTGGGPRVFGTNLELPGGQSELAAVPAADTTLRRVPDAVGDDAAVLLTDILPTGYWGARNAGVGPGDTVAVIGLGPVGIFALQSAQLLGAARVLAVDVDPGRMARAAALGAVPVDARQGTPAQVLELTGGRGADSVIEAVGRDETVTDALWSVRAGGTVSVIGVNVNPTFSFPMGLAFLRDLTFRIGLCPVPTTWAELVPLVEAGRLRPEEVVTHHLGLSEVAEAYRRFDAHEDGVLKVVLDPTR